MLAIPVLMSFLKRLPKCLAERDWSCALVQGSHGVCVGVRGARGRTGSRREPWCAAQPAWLSQVRTAPQQAISRRMAASAQHLGCQLLPGSSG